MKKIGMLAGMSWKSSLEYYRIINEKMAERRGGDHSAELVMYSFDFNDIIRMQHEGRWDELGEMLGEKAQHLKNSGADVIIICANTMHKVADTVEEKSGLPVLHLVDAVAERIKEKELKRVGLIGTKYVMGLDFYTDRLRDEHGIETVLPEGADKERVHDIIYEELCRGIERPGSKDELLQMIDELKGEGAQGMILGCTEIPLVIKKEDVDVPLFDTMRIHAEKAVEHSLQ